MAEHTLVWRYSRDSERPCGGDSLLSWQLLESRGTTLRLYQTGPINQLATSAIAMAMVGNAVTIGAWGSVDPAVTAPEDLETLFLDLRPQGLVCPERPVTTDRPTVDRWIISYDGNPPASLPAAAIQAELARMVAEFFPPWRPRDTASWIPTCLMVRPNISGEQLGLVEPEPLVGDRLLNAIAADPEVFAAYRAEDASLPETTYALARARLDAQERRRIQPEQRVFLHSGTVESILTPLLFNMMGDLTVEQKEGANPGEKIPVLTILREKLRPYGALAEMVLCSILRDYPHPVEHLDRLREAARATAAAA